MWVWLFINPFSLLVLGLITAVVLIACLGIARALRFTLAAFVLSLLVLFAVVISTL